MTAVRIEASFEAWRDVARVHLVGRVPPSEVHFEDANGPQRSLFELGAAPDPGSAARAGSRLGYPAGGPSAPRIPGRFMTEARQVAVHRDPARWDLLYRLLWRLTHGEPSLMRLEVDDDVIAFQRMLNAVRRDVHKMHAFVRFRAATDGGQTRYVAWYRPDHAILRLAVPHFVARFASLQWSILTEAESAHWDGTALHFGPGCPRESAPGGDPLEGLWRVYYKSIFNPARLKVRMMRQEMPRRYWHTLPEAQLIDQLVAEAPRREALMVQQRPASALDYMPESDADFASVAHAAKACQACPWAAKATQMVFGEGPLDAPIMLVGEQPGDMEDLEGRPFVGPAGQLLNKALTEAGIQRDEVYMTNAVKHFKFEPRGKRRIHQRPLARDVSACRPWLAAEAQKVRPRVLICLGASAAQSVLGKATRLRDVRGEVIATPWCDRTVVTTHPSAVLRAVDEATRRADYEGLVQDLAAALQIARE